MNIKLAQFLKKVTDDCGNQECELRTNYSGRGMYGRETAGIVVDSPGQLIMDLVSWTKNNIHDFCDDNTELEEWGGGEIPEALGQLSTDSMGHSTILY